MGFDTDEPIEKGDLFHKMIEQYYLMCKEGTRPGFDETMRILEGHGEQHLSKLALDLNAASEVFRTVREYLNFYWDEPIVTLGVEQVASKIMYQDDDLTILYETKIDWIVKLKNMPVLPVDHKTSSRRSETLATSNQFMGYCWMLDVSNLMVNKVGFQKTLKPHEKFTRPIMSYAPSVIRGWVENSVFWVKRLIENDEKKFWPQNFTSCDKYNRHCPFARVCEAPVETRGHLTRSMFNIGDKWDIGGTAL